LFNPNPNPNPINIRKENPNPNPRNPKKTLSVALKMANGLSQITIEKLNKNNFQVWKFRIMNFLMGKGYWEFITGDETKPPLPENPTQQQIQANKTWHEKVKKVLYWLSVSVSDSMIVHIQDAKSPKQAWDTLVKMYSTNTQARKMQLNQELHNL
jgi:hypothetical protein